MTKASKSFEDVVNNLNKEVAKIIDRTYINLIKAGIEIQRMAQMKTPHDTGNMKASARTIWKDGSRKNVVTPYVGPQAEKIAENDAKLLEFLQAKANTGFRGKEIIYVAYGAFYSLYQHEGVSFARPNGGEAKFLEHAIKENMDKIKKIVAGKPV